MVSYSSTVQKGFIIIRNKLIQTVMNCQNKVCAFVNDKISMQRHRDIYSISYICWISVIETIFGQIESPNHHLNGESVAKTNQQIPLGGGSVSKSYEHTSSLQSPFFLSFF